MKTFGGVPWWACALLGVLVLCVLVLAGSLAKQGQRYRILFDQVYDIDVDLATAEARIEGMMKDARRTRSSLEDIHARSPIKPQPVLPAVPPATNPIARQGGGKHRARPDLPY